MLTTVLSVSLLAGTPLAVSAPTAAPEVAVPFACGRAFTVSQAHDAGSHRHNDTYAWDFQMPEGEPIVAAMDGVVRLTRGDSRRGGCDARYANEANYVVIAHANGLETQYLHFSRVVVSPGDPVNAGDLIGYSGMTGWACGAHLHFKVARTLHDDGWNNPSILAHLAGFGDPSVGVTVRSMGCGLDRPSIASLTAAELEAPIGGALAQGTTIVPVALREP